MTSEKLYTSALNVLNVLERKDLAEQIRRDPAGFLASKDSRIPTPEYDSAAEILVYALQKMEGSRTSASAVSAVKRIINNVPSTRTCRGIYRQNGKFCVCDGYRALRLDQDIKSLPHIPDEDGLDLAPVMDEVAERVPMDLPSLAEIKAAVAVSKNALKRADGREKYKYEKGYPIILADGTAVNAAYLLDLVQALENVRAYRNGKCRVNIYLEGNNGDGVLLPVLKRSGLKYVEGGEIRVYTE